MRGTTSIKSRVTTVASAAYVPTIFRQICAQSCLHGCSFLCYHGYAAICPCASAVGVCVHRQGSHTPGSWCRACFLHLILGPSVRNGAVSFLLVKKRECPQKSQLGKGDWEEAGKSGRGRCSGSTLCPQVLCVSWL